jgi:RimJ/RimL family protein N-acetyltransferase
VIEGRHVRLERFDPARHSADLHEANTASDAIWDYLPYGPFASLSDYRIWAENVAGNSDPFFYALRDRATGRAGGVASFLRISPAAGSIEVGHIALAPALQRTPAATEAMALMMGWAFAAGYRRYEWKCDALNLASRRAAQRLGLSYEGTFRQAAVIKGRNRDTAWFAAVDTEWPRLSTAFDRWLAAENFDPAGRQKQSLSALTAPILAARDPAL